MKTASKSATSPTRVLTAHVPSTLAKKVDDMADRMERSRGWIIKQALLAWVDEEEERHRLTLEALEEVESGKGIQHSSVLAWAASLSTAKPLRPPTR